MPLDSPIRIARNSEGKRIEEITECHANPAFGDGVNTTQQR